MLRATSLLLIFATSLVCSAAEWTETSLTAWALDIERGFADGDDGAAFLAVYDIQRVIVTTLAPMKLAPAVERDVGAGMVTGAAKLAQRMSAQLGSSGGYHLLRVHRVEGDWRALFRFVTDDASLNYHDLLLQPGLDGTPRIVDIYMAASGELLSTTMRNLAVPMLATIEPGILARLFGTNTDATSIATTLQDLPKLQASGQHEEALRLIDALPEPVRTTKGMQLNRVVSGQHLDEDTYRRVLNEYNAAFPGDPSLTLLNIDAQLLAGRYDDCLASIDALDAFLGGDPYLESMRASTLVAAGRAAAAIEHANRAVAGEPRLQEMWWVLVTAGLSANDHDTVLNGLLELERRFAIEFQDLATVEEYAGFVASPHYQRWLQRHGATNPDGDVAPTP